MFRLMTGLQKKPCPETQYGGCYWCGVPLHYSDRVYIGDMLDHHLQGCPWREVAEYKVLKDEWDARLEPGDDGQEAEARVSEGHHEPPTD